MISDFNSEEAYKQFIDSGWGRFAAIAYKHYLSEGRGVIYLDLGLAEHLGLGVAHAQFKYFTPESEPLMFDSDAHRAIDEYDPQREVVFLLFLPNEESLTYIVKGQTSPPDAYISQLTAAPVLTTNN